MPLEGDRWIVTLAGAARDYPPNDDDGFLTFARSLDHPIIYEHIKDLAPNRQSGPTDAPRTGCVTMTSYHSRRSSSSFLVTPLVLSTPSTARV